MGKDRDPRANCFWPIFFGRVVPAVSGASEDTRGEKSRGERLYGNSTNFFVMSATVRIVKTPDVLHGKPRIEGTRIGVYQIGELVRQQKWTLADVTEEFDLDRTQAATAVEYYDEHPELIETLRAQREAARRTIRERSRAE